MKSLRARPCLEAGSHEAARQKISELKHMKTIFFVTLVLSWFSAPVQHATRQERQKASTGTTKAVGKGTLTYQA